MFGRSKHPASSTRLDPAPIGYFRPGIVWEGCGTGKAYAVYLAENRKVGVISFDHCASLSCYPMTKDEFPVGFVHDLHHSAEWKSLSPGLSVNLGLSAPHATTWREIRHFRIPFGQTVLNIFATGFRNYASTEDYHATVARCCDDIRNHNAELDRIASELEEYLGGF